MRVLVTTTDPKVTGGVSSYFSVLRPFLESIADYYPVGLRGDEASTARMILRLFCDYFGFFAKLLRRRYRLVHINTAFGRRAFPRDAVFVLLARALGRRVLVFVHGGDAGCLAPAWKRLFPLVYGHVDAFVVLAARHAEALREFGYAGPIQCETTVAPPEAFAAGPAASETPPRPFRILFLARLEKEKGIHEALEAYRMVRERHPATRLAVAGSGAESAAAHRYVDEHGVPGVEFLGHVSGDAKTAAFLASHLYLLPSHFEGMPTSLLEAMAHGLPVVTRRVGGVADFFEDGVMGFSTDSAEPAVLAGLIEKVMENPGLAARMGRENRAYAEQRFAAPVVARRLLGIYSDVLDRAPRKTIPAWHHALRTPPSPRQ